MKEDLKNISNEDLKNTLEKIYNNIPVQSQQSDNKQSDNKEKKVALDMLVKFLVNKDSMDRVRKRINSYLMKEGKIQPKNKEEKRPFYPTFTVLKRYNSSSPIIPRTATRVIKGGGYFIITAKRKGIVIDPGVEFIRNLFDEGFAIADIDAIVITHAHIDHTGQLEELFTLLYEYNDQLEKEGKRDKIKKISLILNVGVTSKMISWILTQKEVVREVYTIGVPYNPDRVKTANDKIKLPQTPIDLKDDLGIEINIFPVKHNELITDEYSTGLILSFYSENDEFLGKVGITSDTGYFEGMHKYFSECNPIIIHLGDITLEELENVISNNEKASPKENHLCFMGLLKLISEIDKDKDIILSEFPEEMGSYRKLVAAVIKEKMGKNIITSDIGLTFTYKKIKDKKYQPAYRCDICHLDNYLREKKGFDSIFHFFNSIETPICIDSEDERMEYRCKKKPILSPKRLWVQSSKYWHRKIFTFDCRRLSEEENTQRNPSKDQKET